jgi:5-methyltetrahydrofolate--homocysteine methyltransferase
MADLSELAKTIEKGDRDAAVKETEKALDAGVSPEQIIIKGLQVGMGMVGEKFSSGEYFLPDMLLAARAMKASLEVLKPLLARTGMPTIGRVIIGTVEGDMHDIGKNIVATFLSGGGFEVFDLGLNVPNQKFIDAVREEKPHILGLSALLTTTMPNMGRIIKTLEEEGLRAKVKVIVGGAPVTAHYARLIGADAYARDGGEAIPVCKKLVGK